MIVTVEDILSTFDSLVNQGKQREDVANWASSVRQAEDSSDLKYQPPEMEQDIWSAILFLEGVDFKDGPNEYLHNQEDMQAAYKKFLDSLKG